MLEPARFLYYFGVVPARYTHPEGTGGSLAAVPPILRLTLFINFPLLRNFRLPGLVESTP